MARSKRTEDARHTGTSHVPSQVTRETGFVAENSESAQSDSARRVILFPTEPSSIGRKKIDRAVETVISRKK
ncbi:MAG: hypothetical protein M3Q69_14050 [Acidobacteriota bacterium]|nr:hypothetical protein [Acidobacteriota bacterium]